MIVSVGLVVHLIRKPEHKFRGLVINDIIPEAVLSREVEIARRGTQIVPALVIPVLFHHLNDKEPVPVVFQRSVFFADFQYTVICMKQVIKT